MNSLRRLEFETLDEAGQEASRLLESGYVLCGDWSLGQICRHLTLVQAPSIDGYPFWLSVFAPLRPVMRWRLLPKLLDVDSQLRIRTIKAFMPPDDADDAIEVEKYCQSVDRLNRHTQPFAPHPAFGRIPRQQLLRIHAAHAAHHLRFLKPVHHVTNT